jgi:hypothetical protein
MTVQEAKDILAKNLWERNPVWKDKFDIFIGDLVEETFDDNKYFPNCYILNVAMVDKGRQSKKREWDEWFVSKIDGHIGSTEIVGNVA